MSDDLDHQLSHLRGRVATAWSDARAETVLLVVEHRRARRHQLRRVAGGALGLLLLLVPLWLLRGPGERSTPEAAGALHLSDGSVATALSADAELRESKVEPGRRVLHLLRGSARFQVQRDPRRIFRVESGRIAVEVLGTQFVVTRLGESAEIVVIAGRVRVLWDGHHRELGAGERGLFPPPEPAAPMTVRPTPHESPPDAELPPPPPPPQTPGAARPETPRARSDRDANRWRELAQQGQFDKAYGAVGAKNLAATSDELGDLLLLADIARLSHHPVDAVAPLEKLLQQHRADPRAALCAFTLGRVLLDDLGKPREAAAAFHDAQVLDPSFALLEDALAREIKALWQAGDSLMAHARAEEYLRRFPAGRQARAVRRYGGMD